MKSFSRFTWASAGTDLQPDVLGGGGDGRDLKAGLAALGDQLAGVDVVLGRELGFDANPDAVCRAPVGVAHLNLWGERSAGDSGETSGKQKDKQASDRPIGSDDGGLTFPL